LESMWRRHVVNYENRKSLQNQQLPCGSLKMTIFYFCENLMDHIK
jgi:hypothetical protein